MAKDADPIIVPEPGTEFMQEDDTVFTLRGEIRRGGMGAIFLAHDQEVDRDVAMKLLLGDDKIERKRFFQEAKLTGSLEHPNIVPIHGMGRDTQTGHVYFTMKLIDGENLREIIQHIKKEIYTTKEWNWTKLLNIFVHICHAIEFAHAKQVIHRDLKPSNIMVGKFGEVQVMDWGVAKHLGKQEEQRKAQAKKPMPQGPDEASGEWTVDGDVIGTIAYMPPEQAMGLVHQLDERSDVYSMGAILYEILCLRPPIRGKDVAERLEKVENNDIEWPHVQTPERHIPRDLSCITMKALSKDPDDRYQSVGELREDIERYLHLRPVLASGYSKIDIAWKFLRRHSAISVVVGIAGILLMILFFIMYVVTANQHRIALENYELAKSSLDQFKLEQKERIAAVEDRVKLELERARDAKREWQLEIEEDFRYKPDDWEVRGGDGTEWELRKGELFIRGGRPHLFVYKRPVIGDIKFEFDCRLEGSYLNDVSCFISAFEEDDPMSMGKNGYYIGYGCHDNKRVVLSRNEKTLHSELSEPLRAGETYHVVVEHIGQEISLTVNGKLIYRVKDDKPLLGSSRNKIGLFGYMSDTYYDNIKIYKLAQSRKVDILTLADFYMNSGQYGTAQDLYENVSDTAVDIQRVQQARAGVELAMEYKRKERFMESYERQANRAFKGNPRVSLTDRGLELDASGLGVSNLRQIQGLPFNYIDMSHTDAEDLTPLKSMPLRHLNLEGSQVTDLLPLRGMSLQYLNLKDTPLEEIVYIRGMPLRYLDLRNTQVKKLNIIAGMPLRVLHAPQATVDDPQIFAKMPLRELSITGKNIRDLSFLKGKRITQLRIDDTSVSDLSVLKDMPLEALMVRNTLVDDLSPIYDKDIRVLGISGLPLKDYTFLKEYKLRTLLVAYSDFSDLNLVMNPSIEFVGCEFYQS